MPPTAISFDLIQAYMANWHSGYFDTFPIVATMKSGKPETDFCCEFLMRLKRVKHVDIDMPDAYHVRPNNENTRSGIGTL